MRLNLKGSATLYALDMICVLLAVSLVAFTLYVIPYVVLGYTHYNVPEFVVRITAWYETHHNLGRFTMIILFLGPFILAAFAFILISKLITYYLETHEHEPGVPHVDVEELEEHKRVAGVSRERKEINWRSTMLIISLMALVIFVLVIAEYFVIINVF